MACGLLVEFDDFDDSLGVLLLFGSGDTRFLEELLPFLGETGELAGGGVESDVREVDGVIRRGYLWSLGRVEKVW